MNDSFKKGFLKVASPELIHQNYNDLSDDEGRAKRQQLITDKKRGRSGPVVEQQPTRNPSDQYLTERF